MFTRIVSKYYHMMEPQKRTVDTPSATSTTSGVITIRMTTSQMYASTEQLAVHMYTFVPTILRTSVVFCSRHRVTTHDANWDAAATLDSLPPRYFRQPGATRSWMACRESNFIEKVNNFHQNVTRTCKRSLKSDEKSREM